MKSTLAITGMDGLLRSLRQMNPVMRTRILVPAADSGIKKVQRAIAPLIPVQRGGVKLRSRQAARRRASDHYRNVLTSAVREYANTGSVLALTGAESGKAPHAHLVEDGSKQRFTNSKTIYRREPVGIKMVLKNGRLVRKADRQKKAIGSRQKKKNNPQLNRGVMPALHPVARGVAASEGAVASGLRADITAGITREFTAAKLQRGNA